MILAVVQDTPQRGALGYCRGAIGAQHFTRRALAAAGVLPAHTLLVLTLVAQRRRNRTLRRLILHKGCRPTRSYSQPPHILKESSRRIYVHTSDRVTCLTLSSGQNQAGWPNLCVRSV